jgi:hypothetical protein
MAPAPADGVGIVQVVLLLIIATSILVSLS